MVLSTLKARTGVFRFTSLARVIPESREEHQDEQSSGEYRLESWRFKTDMSLYKSITGLTPTYVAASQQARTRLT
jgi:hypothetical protein